jgi:MYXO-CTERM domain-containing protein
MMSRFGSAVAFGAALAASLLGATREASACSPPPDGWFMWELVEPAPENGVVIVKYSCYSECENPPLPENVVLHEAGELVPGSVVLSGASGHDHFLVFRPEAGALTSDSVYTAELEGVSSSATVHVGPAVTWSETITPTHEIFEIDQPVGETQCCTGPIDTCGGTPCFRTQVDRRTAINVSWGDGTRPEDFQYAFRILHDGTDADVPWSWNGASTGFELAATEDSACYVLELQRLADGVIQTFEERCIERPATFTPGLHPTPEETIAGVLVECEGPPPGYEDAWCESCERSPNAYCAGFTEMCPDTGSGGAGGSDGASGSGGTTDTGGTAGATGGSSGSSGAQGGSSATGGSNATGGSSGSTSGTGGTSGTGEGGTPGQGDAGESNEGDGERVVTKGCGCAVPGNTSQKPASLGLLALGLLALRLRRSAKQRAA